MRHNITFTDACYVALARRLDAPLLTSDMRLAAAPTFLQCNSFTSDASPPDAPTSNVHGNTCQARDQGRSPSDKPVRVAPNAAQTLPDATITLVECRLRTRISARILCAASRTTSGFMFRLRADHGVVVLWSGSQEGKDCQDWDERKRLSRPSGKVARDSFGAPRLSEVDRSSAPSMCVPNGTLRAVVDACPGRAARGWWTRGEIGRWWRCTRRARFRDEAQGVV